MSKIFSCFLFFSLFYVVSLFTSHSAFAAAITWDGGGNDTICGGAGTGNNWSCKQNWNTDTVPGSVDTVTFNGTSTKDSTVDATHSGVLNTITLNSGYTGTLSLARSLNTTSAFSIASGTFTAGANDLNVDAGFTINGGVFNAPSTTLFAAGTFTISAGTFNHNSGTVTFDGSGSGTLSCNNVAFNLVTFTHTSSTKTVSSNCSLPLGASPTVGGSASALTLSGTLSGSGTLTFTGGFTNNASTSILSGFSGIVVNGAFINQNSAVLNLGSYTTVDFNAAFTLTTGTFTAPAGTMTAASTFSLNGGTFNANGGTLTFDGTASVTISCSGASFNLVTFAHTSGTKTISSNCGLPVGSNPTLGTTTTAAITNNGAATGSGTLTFSGAYTHNASSSALTGFSGLVVGSTFTNQNSAVLDLGSYTTADFNGAFVLSSGSFTAPSGIMTIALALTISGTPTFNANGGTVTFDGNAATLSCNNVVFNLVIINANSSQTKTVNSNCTLPLGNNPTVSTISLNGTLTGSGTMTKASYLNLFGLTLNSGAVLSGFTGLNLLNPLSIAGATFDASGYTLTNVCSLTISSGVFISPSNINLNCLFSQSGGTFTAPSGTLTVPQNFSHTAGTFNHNNGTVNLTSTATNHTLLGSTTFYNLSRTTTGTLSIGAGTTQTILGTLTLQGSSSTKLLLRSTVSGSQWNIDPQGPRVISNLDVQDSNNVNTSAIVAQSSTNSGNNTNWTFTSSPLAFVLQNPGNNTYTSNTRPTFQWQGAVVNSGSSLSKYVLSVDNGDTGDFSIDNIPTSGTQDIDNDKYSIHFDGFNDNDPINNSISLHTKDSATWGPNENDGLLKEGKRSWTITAYDTAGNAISQSGEFFVDETGPSMSLATINNHQTLLNPLTGALQTVTQLANRKLTFFGTITDPLRGDTTNNAIAAGVKDSSAMTIQIEKRKYLLLYDLVSIDALAITDNYNTTDGSIITDNTQNKSDKYSRFSYTTTKPLTAGIYKVTIVGNDSVNNFSTPLVFYVTVGSGSMYSSPGSQTRKKTQANTQPGSLPLPQTIPQGQGIYAQPVGDEKRGTQKGPFTFFECIWRKTLTFLRL